VKAIYMVNIGSDFDTPILEVNKDEKKTTRHQLVKIMTAIFTPRAFGGNWQTSRRYCSYG